MFTWELNDRLVTAIIAASLCFTFIHDQSTPVHLKEFPELKNFSIQESFSTDKTMDKLHTRLFEPITKNEAWFTIARIVGLICGWPIAEIYGRKQGLLLINIVRFVGVGIQIVFNIDGQPYLSLHDNQNFTDELNLSTNTTVPEATKVEASTIQIFMLSKIIDGFYSGLSYFIGILYVYEISAKSSSKIGSLSALAFYILLKSSFDYFASFLIVYYDPVKGSVKSSVTLGLVLILMGLIQIFILIKFCPESPSFLVVQRNKREKAKRALKKIRSTDQIDEELELLEMDQNKANSLMRRTMFLVSLYLIYSIHTSIFLFVALLQTVQFGVPLNTCVNLYLIIGILSYFIPLIYFDSSSFQKLKINLFLCYSILGLTYFAHSFLTTINHHVSHYSFHSNQHIAIAAIQVLVSIVTIIAFSCGPGIITLVLINEYSCQSDRSKNLVISWVLGYIVAYKLVEIFAGIFTKALLYVYVFTTWPWVTLGLFTWSVWKFETKGYSDGNGNFQENRNPPVSTTEITVVEKSESETAM